MIINTVSTYSKGYTYSCCYTLEMAPDFTLGSSSSWQGRLQIGFVIVGNTVVFPRPQAMLAGCGVRWICAYLSPDELSLEVKVGMCTWWESNYGSNGRHWLACKPTCRFQPNFWSWESEMKIVPGLSRLNRDGCEWWINLWWLLLGHGDMLQQCAVNE